jgi:deoxyribose-phosphate aldolase
MHDRLQRARQIVSLLDLTTLSGAETPHEIDVLCQRAATVCGPVAALCVPLRHVARARSGLDRLGLDGVGVATVANFPGGGLDLAASVSEIREAVDQGASEVDLVWPYRAFLHGQESPVRQFLDGCRQACPVRLKVIIESGVLGDAERIRAASRLVLECGADFLKTSTGKAAVHATPEAARAMLSVIAESGGRAGFKASGGLRTMSDALAYLELAEEILGPAWIGPHTFRFGASALLDDVLAQAAREGGCAGPA